MHIQKLKPIVLSVIAAASLMLGGCAVYPAYGPYGSPYAVVAPAPVVVYHPYYYGGYGYHHYRHY